MEIQQLKELIIKELPALMRQDSSLKEWVLSIGRTQFADKATSEDHFREMMDALKQQMEENQRKWDENQRKWDENQRKWDENQRRLDEIKRESDERWAASELRWKENDRKWEENQKSINEQLAAIRKLDQKHEQSIGALGARWGLRSEESFRAALAGILEELPSGIEVMHINEFDDIGEVFGRPDQIELDLIMRNGTLLIAEIKSSMSRGEMYLFERKARFYEKKHQRTANSLIVISPMVDKRAREVAAKLGIKVYSYADEVEF